jgi:hypothetical protein
MGKPIVIFLNQKQLHLLLLLENVPSLTVLITLVPNLEPKTVDNVLNGDLKDLKTIVSLNSSQTIAEILMVMVDYGALLLCRTTNMDFVILHGKIMILCQKFNQNLLQLQ